MACEAQNMLKTFHLEKFGSKTIEHKIEKKHTKADAILKMQMNEDNDLKKPCIAVHKDAKTLKNF